MQDLFDQADVGAAAFVLSLREKGIRSTPVLRAMEQVGRDLFAPHKFRDLSRADVALPLPCGQTMTGPTTVALMLVALGLEEGQRVLEVGTGSGYVTALLARMGGQVTSVERHLSLAASAHERLKNVGGGPGAMLEVGDGLVARPRGTLYERILLNGALHAIPQSMTDLLPNGGRLVGAFSKDGFPRLVTVERQADGALRQELGGSLRLSPLVNAQPVFA